MKTLRLILAIGLLAIIVIYGFPISCEIQRTGRTLNGNPLNPTYVPETTDKPIDAPLEYKIPESVR